MLFSDNAALIGNENVKTCLEQMLHKQKIPQVLLFAGQEGVGKSLFARHFAACLMGESHREKIFKNTHPDFHSYVPEGKNMQYPIATVRKLIEESQLPPFQAPCKVFLLADIDGISSIASNALLKTFEEPLPGTYFILLSNHPKKLLPTILSRVCKIDFYPVETSKIENWLKAQGKSPEEAHNLALIASGSPATAELARMIQQRKKLVSTMLTETDYRKTTKILQDLDKELEAIQAQEPEAFFKHLDQIFTCIFYWYRDLYAIQSKAKNKLFYYDMVDLMQEQKDFPSFEKVAELIQAARIACLQNIRSKTVLEQLLLDLGKY